MDLIPTALTYLARYAASTSHLRLVLQRKVYRRAQRTDTEPPSQADLNAAIDAAVDRMTELGLLNDREYAASLARNYRNRGEPIGKIRLRLQAKGLPTDAIHQATQSLDDNELDAALRYAKRKRLGPYRLRPGKPDQSQRDVASLCRAGFPLTIARKVITP